MIPRASGQTERMRNWGERHQVGDGTSVVGTSENENGEVGLNVALTESNLVSLMLSELEMIRDELKLLRHSLVLTETAAPIEEPLEGLF